MDWCRTVSYTYHTCDALQFDIMRMDTEQIQRNRAFEIYRWRFVDNE